MANELKAHIHDLMPLIDELLELRNTPIHYRFLEAGDIFVNEFVQDSTFDSKEELLESDVYLRCVLPLFNDWYFEKYGDLIDQPVRTKCIGVAIVYNRPIELKIPLTTSEVVKEGELSKMTFPDHMQSSESVKELIVPNINIENMAENIVTELTEQVDKIVAHTRSINIDIMMASNLSQFAKNMSVGIWGHFEKGIMDILSFQKAQASVACWEFHLAIEKSLKVLIQSKAGKKKYGHNLEELVLLLNDYGCEIDSSRLISLPTGQEAIQLRYAEIIRQPSEAFSYYLIALEFVASVVSKLDHKFGIKNASFTLKKAPWAR